MEEVFGKEHPYTHLVPDLKGVDPDDAFSTVPYEKGSNFLMYLEQKLGGPGMHNFISKTLATTFAIDMWVVKRVTKDIFNFKVSFEHNYLLCFAVQNESAYMSVHKRFNTKF